jgi:hypothetical protein
MNKKIILFNAEKLRNNPGLVVISEPPKSELIYLAVPYTHKDHFMMVARSLLANKVAAKLMAKGKYIFSPISYTHPIAEAGNGILPRGWEYWQGYDRRILSCCNRILILRLPGWETSTGVQAEIKIGQELGIPIEYIDYEPFEEINDVVEMAKALEKVSLSNNKTSVSSYSGAEVCVNSTNVCSDGIVFSSGDF